jgi:hypothetical protein
MNFNNLKYNIGFVFGGIINVSELMMIFILMYYGYDSIISKIYSSMKRNEVTNQLLLSMNEKKLNKTIFNESMNQLLKSNSLIQIVNQKYFYDDLPYNLAIIKENFIKSLNIILWKNINFQNI